MALAVRIEQHGGENTTIVRNPLSLVAPRLGIGIGAGTGIGFRYTTRNIVASLNNGRTAVAVL